MHFYLISNYPPDKQESMRRYAEGLRDGLIDRGVQVEIWKPVVFFACLMKNTNSGIGKWLGYLDKWILFPLLLKIKLLQPKYKNRSAFFHICDHSNSPYLAVLPKDRTGITCHDVLAIRGAMGFEDAYCPASKTGILLQKWILLNLKKAKILTAVSKFTLDQLQELAGTHANWKLIHNAFNANFFPMSAIDRMPYLSKLGIDSNKPFILHIGSSLPRKNRKLLVKMVATLGDKWEGNICFAGQKVTERLQNTIVKYGLQDRVISILNPNHMELVALYSSCEAFVFPSYSEGFGWPVIEAQACGVPVIASDIAPMQEVCGDSVQLIDSDDEKGFAQAFVNLQDSTVRDQWIRKGFENCKRFDRKALIEQFVKLYVD